MTKPQIDSLRTSVYHVREAIKALERLDEVLAEKSKPWVWIELHRLGTSLAVLNRKHEDEVAP